MIWKDIDLLLDSDGKTEIVKHHQTHQWQISRFGTISVPEITNCEERWRYVGFISHEIIRRKKILILW